MRVTIDTAETTGFGLAMHTLYHCSAVDVRGAQFAARRRYTDFVAFSRLLLKQAPLLHSTLPDLPEKKIIGAPPALARAAAHSPPSNKTGKFKPALIARRCLGLQEFVDALVAQQATSQVVAPLLRQFLSDAPQQQQPPSPP